VLAGALLGKKKEKRQAKSCAIRGKGEREKERKKPAPVGGVLELVRNSPIPITSDYLRGKVGAGDRGFNQFSEKRGEKKKG